MRVRIITTRRAPVSLRDLLSRAVRGHDPAIPVERREIPYWRERGWTFDGSTYTGTYQTPVAAFRGRIEQERSGRLAFYLYNPSRQIRGHSHWICFASRSDGWYFVHMGRRPKDASSGIMTIERLIREAYES